MDRHFVPSQFQRRLVSSVADDDDPIFVDDDRLTPAKLAEGRGHGVYPGIVLTRVVLVGPDRMDRPHFDIHDNSPSPFGMISVCRFRPLHRWEGKSEPFRKPAQKEMKSGGIALMSLALLR